MFCPMDIHIKLPTDSCLGGMIPIFCLSIQCYELIYIHLVYLMMVSDVCFVLQESPGPREVSLVWRLGPGTRRPLQDRPDPTKERWE